MFVDIYYCKFDEKSRLMLPVDLRKRLAPYIKDGITLNYNLLTKCIDILTQENMKRIEDYFNQLDQFDPEHLEFMNLTFAHTKSAIIDNTGRMLVAPELKSIAQLGKEVVIKGVGFNFAIWNKESYEATVQKGMDTYPELAQNIRKYINK